MAFLAEIKAHLKPNWRFLLVEPYGHVRSAAFRRSVEMADNGTFFPAALGQCLMTAGHILSYT
jgi:hypothetical protein